MKNLLFMNIALNKMKDMEFIKKILTIIMYILAGGAAFSGLFLLIGMTIQLATLPGAVIFFGILFTLAIGVVFYIVTHTILIRAVEVRDIQLDEYPILTLISKLIKVVGEVYISFMLPSSIAIGILIIITGADYSIYNLLDPFMYIGFFEMIGYGVNVLDGFLIIFIGVMTSLVAFFTSYGIAEIIGLVKDIAKKSKK